MAAQDTTNAPLGVVGWKLVAPEAHDGIALPFPPGAKIIFDNALLPDDWQKVSESIQGEKDERKRVEAEHFQDGGKYRSIVKVISRFRPSSESNIVSEDNIASATGWLIAPHIVVTAGHAVYNKSKRLGFKNAIEVKCYVGYKGAGYVKKNLEDVQQRYGRVILTTSKWIDHSSQTHDIAFIFLDKEFTGTLNIFPYTNTPKSDKTTLGVVGYPGDHSLDGEKGAEMYEEFKSVDYMLEPYDYMIEYGISTFAGQSGSPVLCSKNSTLSSIGTHCYGGYAKTPNSGNPIGGHGNDYEHIVPHWEFVRSNEPVTINMSVERALATEPFIRTATKIDLTPITNLSGIYGFLEPFVSLINASVGTLIRHISVNKEKGLESYDNLEKDAAIAEAVLVAFGSLQYEDDDHIVCEESLKLTKTAADLWQRAHPNDMELAKSITPLVFKCTMQFMEKLLKRTNSSEIESQGDKDLVMVFNDLVVGDDASTPESFMSGLKGASKTLAKHALSLLSEAAMRGISDFVKNIGKHAESSEPPKIPAYGNILDCSEDLITRAFIAAALLEAVRKLPKETLSKLKVVSTGQGANSTESFIIHVQKQLENIERSSLDIAKEVAENCVAQAVESGHPKPESSGLENRNSNPRKTVLEHYRSVLLD